MAWHLKAAGYDALKITGVSSSPVVLSIVDDQVQIESASDLWGLTVSAAVAQLKPPGAAALIGPAGENQVLYANIITADGNAAGRGGLGAVMGSKQLKAIQVIGTQPLRIADPMAVQRSVDDVLRLLNAAPVIFGEMGFSRYGTAALIDLLAQRRMVPTKNFRETFFAATHHYSAPALRKHFQPLSQGCHDCPIACKKITRDQQRLPEHGSLSHFGALLGISDPETIVAACRLCNDLGLDTLSAAATIAAYSESTGEWPGAAELPAYLRQIAMRQGSGDHLARGARRLMADLGRPELAMTVKGLEIPAYDPRGAYGMALAYATSNRGGCHLPAYAVAHEILRKPVASDRFDFTGKAWMNINAENAHAVGDSLGACRFTFLAAGLEEYAALLTGVTGVDFSAAQLFAAGERIWLTERYYNQLNGFTADDDTLPERFFLEPGSSGKGIGVPAIDRQRFFAERARYYRLRGLDEAGQLPRHFLDEQP